MNEIFFQYSVKKNRPLIFTSSHFRLPTVKSQDANLAMTTIQFSGVMANTQEFHIREYFNKFGSVTEIQIDVDENQQRTGTGTVVFSLPEIANEFIKTAVHKIGKSKLHSMKLI